MSRTTALHSAHLAAGGRMVDFAGWTMPVQYSGIIDEHRAVRESCGVFDISHMGEFFVRGPGAVAWLDRLLTNRASALEPGQAQYSLLLNESGGVIDDLYVYRTSGDEFLLIVNASMIETDAEWMRSHGAADAEFEDASGRLSALAVQGPLAATIFRQCFGRDLPAERNRILELERGGEAVWVATTGYTGEAGFEAVCPSKMVGGLWDALIAAGAKPCGLGARDTLRLEMGYPLNGNDLSPARTPLEAGLGFFVDFSKEDFIGREAMLRQKESGIPARLCGIMAEGKMPPLRAHYPVWSGEELVGETCSGGLSPTLGVSIAMAYLPPALSVPGTPLSIEIRGSRFPARVVRKPFVNIKK